MVKGAPVPAPMMKLAMAQRCSVFRSLPPRVCMVLAKWRQELIVGRGRELSWTPLAAASTSSWDGSPAERGFSKVWA